MTASDESSASSSTRNCSPVSRQFISRAVTGCKGKRPGLSELSINDRGRVNVFLMKIKGKYDDEEELPYDAIALNNIRYYSIVPCNFNRRNNE